MATREDLTQDLAVGLTEVRRTLQHYNMGQWEEYLVVRQPGEPESYVILRRPSCSADFEQKLHELHLAEAWEGR